MIKKALLGTYVITLLGINFGFAWEMPKVKGLGIGESSKASSAIASLSDLTGSRDKAIGGYLEATKELVISLEKAAEAFGVKKEVLEKLAEAKALKEGNINDKDLKKARKASEEAQEIIEQKMQETKEPSVESKKLMGESMVHLGKGIKKEKDLVTEVKNLADQAKGALSSASIQDKFKVKGIASTALVLSKNIPQDLKLIKDILSTYITYAKANNIKVPIDATNLLEGE